MYFFIFMVATVNSLESKPKYCLNCKYFIPNVNALTAAQNNKLGGCSYFPVKFYDFDCLVTGEKKNPENKYHFCDTARKFDDMCGEEGRHHKRRYNKNTST